MIKAKVLKKGDTIGIVTPASAAKKEALDKGINFLESKGYKVKVSNNALKTFENYAGRDEERVDDINTFFRDDSVDAIICSRGGYGTIRMLDTLDYDCIKSNPKIFGGYSDITSLHLAMLEKSGLITFHSPMVSSDMSNIKCEKSIDMMFETLSSNKAIEYKNPNGESFNCIKEGRASGVLVGGNLAVLMSSFLTPYMSKLPEMILYIEEVDEKPYKIDRMLSTLLISGEIGKSIKGIVVGSFTDCDVKEGESVSSGFKTLKETLDDRFKHFNVPIISNVYCGHDNSKMTIAHGAMVEIDTAKKSFKTLESFLV